MHANTPNPHQFGRQKIQVNGIQGCDAPDSSQKTPSGVSSTWSAGADKWPPPCAIAIRDKAKYKGRRRPGRPRGHEDAALSCTYGVDLTFIGCTPCVHLRGGIGNGREGSPRALWKFPWCSPCAPLEATICLSPFECIYWELLNRPCSLLKRLYIHVTQSHDLSNFDFSIYI